MRARRSGHAASPFFKSFIINLGRQFQVSDYSQLRSALLFISLERGAIAVCTYHNVGLKEVTAVSTEVCRIDSNSVSVAESVPLLI